jgi:organic radical activating enzyme
MKNKQVLPFLETMTTQVCNLSCAGCTNYSDYQHKGYVKWETMKWHLSNWLEVLDIQEFGIIGGEPLINPEINDWIHGCRALLPNKTIRFTTNGLLLHKHPGIVQTMHELGDFTFKITVHKSTQSLEQLIKDIFNMYDWVPVVEYGIQRFRTTNNFRFQINRPTAFVKTFKGEYGNMVPYDSDASDAFSNCCQQTCPLLHNGTIYKCSTAGLLQDMLSKTSDSDPNLWALDPGIKPTDSIKKITEFINNFGRAEYMCKQCPTKHDAKSILDHVLTTTFK